MAWICKYVDPIQLHGAVELQVTVDFIGSLWCCLACSLGSDGARVLMSHGYAISTSPTALHRQIDVPVLLFLPIQTAVGCVVHAPPLLPLTVRPLCSESPQDILHIRRFAHYENRYNLCAYKVVIARENSMSQDLLWGGV